MPMICDYGEEFVPKRATCGSAGYDFFAPQEYALKPNEWTVIDTGVRFDGTESAHYTKMYRPIPKDGYAHTMCIEYPTSWYMAIVPRSGLSFKYGLRIINTVAVIDMDYRDTIKLKVTVEEPYKLAKGERFAQGIVQQFLRFDHEIQPTQRRVGGFGSTGV